MEDDTPEAPRTTEPSTQPSNPDGLPPRSQTTSEPTKSLPPSDTETPPKKEEHPAHLCSYITYRGPNPGGHCKKNGLYKAMDGKMYCLNHSQILNRREDRKSRFIKQTPTPSTSATSGTSPKPSGKTTTSASKESAISKEPPGSAGSEEEDEVQEEGAVSVTQTAPSESQPRKVRELTTSTPHGGEEDFQKLKRKLKRRYKMRAKRQKREEEDSKDIWGSYRYKGPRKMLKKSFRNASKIASGGKREWVQGPMTTVALD